MEENDLKPLQKELAASLALYMDLTEAVCDILTQSPTAPISPADRARLIHLRRQELAALKSYLSLRLRLVTALSIESSPEFRNLYNAVLESFQRPRGHASAPAG